jgi:predicted anti-sigma-YlaC factor YlaD
VAWSAAIALGKDDPDLIGGLPVVDAMIARAAALDPDFDDGGLHTFLISWEMAQPGADERAADVAGRHFRRAVELSEGKRVAPFVAMAESVSVLRNQRRAFEDYLSRAIAIDADSRAEWRLANHVMQRRAQWLLARADMYFLE